MLLPILTREVHEPGPRKGPLPGVPALLDALAGRPDVYLALLTGNFEGGARTKLLHFGLWHYFACGAFGDDAHDRNALLQVALDRMTSAGGPRVPREDIIVVGDTPFDVGVARAGGTRSLGVATGPHGVDELLRSGADAAVEDFGDLQATLVALGLGG